MSGFQEQAQDTINSWWGIDGDNSTMTTSSPGETIPPLDCQAHMEPDAKVFWDLVYSMLVLFILTIMVPWIFCCFRNRPRCLAHIYVLSGLVKVLCGLLLATALLPLCPVGCGDVVCKDVVRYNPTAGFGAVCVCIGVFWFIKACCLRRTATKMEREAAKEAAADSISSSGKSISDQTERTLPDVV
jgi:hypothetical protein